MNIQSLGLHLVNKYIKFCSQLEIYGLTTPSRSYLIAN